MDEEELKAKNNIILVLVSVIIFIIFINLTSCTPNIRRTPIMGETYLVNKIIIVNDTLQYIEVYNRDFPNENYFWIRMSIEQKVDVGSPIKFSELIPYE